MEFLDLRNASDGEVKEIETILKKVSIGVEFPLDFIGSVNDTKLTNEKLKNIETDKNDIDSSSTLSPISSTSISPAAAAANHQTFNVTLSEVTASTNAFEIKQRQQQTSFPSYYCGVTTYPSQNLSSKANPIINQDPLKLSYYSHNNQYPQLISHVQPNLGVSSIPTSSVPSTLTAGNCPCDDQNDSRSHANVPPSNFTIPTFPAPTYPPNHFPPMAAPHATFGPTFCPVYFPVQIPQFYHSLPAAHINPQSPSPTRHAVLPPRGFLHQNGNSNSIVNNTIENDVSIKPITSLNNENLNVKQNVTQKIDDKVKEEQEVDNEEAIDEERHEEETENVADEVSATDDEKVSESEHKENEQRENLTEAKNENVKITSLNSDESSVQKDANSELNVKTNTSSVSLEFYKPPSDTDTEVNKKIEKENVIKIDEQLNNDNDDNNSDVNDYNQTNISEIKSEQSNALCARNEQTAVTPYVARSWADLFKSRNSMNQSFSMGSSIDQNEMHPPSSSFTNDANNEEITNANFKLDDNDAQISISFSEDILSRKLAKKLKDIHLKHSLPFLIPRGFVNRGNWCYINATLQALLYCPPFYNLMREIGEIPGINREKSSTPIIDSFAKFFSNFLPSEPMMKKVKAGGSFSAEDLPSGEPFEPKCIYDVLGQIKIECLKGKQEDAEEFLSSVLNGLHDEMVALFKYYESFERKQNGDALKSNGFLNDEEDIDDAKSNTDDDSALWKEVGPRNKALPMRTTKVVETPIMDIFGGSVLSVRTAGKDVCGNRQPFFTLQLDIQSDKIRSVEDALKVLTSSESIQGYTCPKTKQMVDASYQTFLNQLPPILILHLKLFGYDKDGGSRKLLKKIEYPIDLELPRECVHQERGVDKNKYSKSYKLLAVVHHDGNESVKGHYITDIFHIGSGLWLRCDDNSVKAISTQQLLNPQIPRVPYLLFYRRFDTLRQTQAQRVTGSH